MDTETHGRGIASSSAGIALGLVALCAGCKAHEAKSADYRALYYAGSFEQAGATIDGVIADENGIDESGAPSAADGVPAGIDADEGDTCVFLLDRAMASAGSGNVSGAIELLRASRDTLDEKLGLSLQDIAGSLLVDAASTDYGGHDYEHLMVRSMLAVLDLLEGGSDAYAYANQIGVKQEEILALDYGEQIDFNPREQYQRIAIGAYLEGIIREGEREIDDAKLAFARAQQYVGESAVVEAAVSRASAGAYAGAEEGVLHVFYLGGRGPYLTEESDIASSAAIVIASTLVSLAVNQDATSIGTLAQDAVPFPAAVVQDEDVAPLTVASGDREATTETLLNVNDVVVQQVEANQSMDMAMALARRVIKSVTSGAAGKVVGEGEVLGGLFAAGSNVAMTAGERADTRCWSTLPAEIQVARLALPEGAHEVQLGGGMAASVQIARGQDSFVVVLRPNLSEPGVVLVDESSRP